MNDDFPEFRTSERLARAGFRHAFFTRNGGASAGPYASLSFSLAVGDDPGAVAENLTRAARALGVLPARLHFLSQVHGVGVVVTTSRDDRADVVQQEGDAVVSTDPSCAAAVRIADCVPILIGCVATGGVCAIHAGWRGLAAGVIEAGVQQLRATTGAPGPLVAAIGPHITLPAFEVSEEVAAVLAAAAEDAVVVDRPLGSRPHVSLARIARSQLRKLGLGADDIDDVGGCTYGDPAHFFSFRRDGQASGRHLAAIVPRSVFR